MKKAVLWDFGGVILSSPFEAFNRYETAHGLPPHFIRSVNATNPHDNAWARLERNEIEAAEFHRQFGDESSALGHKVPGADVLALLSGEIRPEMVALLDQVKAAGYKVACLTNNVVGAAAHSSPERAAALADVMAKFDDIVESSKVGVRKPERRFYEIACARLGVMPNECVFLDDLGINLKPAAQMGMTTIKVTSPQQAIDELTDALARDKTPEPSLPVRAADLDHLDEQIGRRNSQLSFLGLFALIGVAIVFGQWWLRWVIERMGNDGTRPPWPVELLYYVVAFDGLLFVSTLLSPIFGHLRDRRLGSVRRGTLRGRIPRWVLRSTVLLAVQYTMAVAVFGALRLPLGLVGVAVAAAAVATISNLQGRRWFSLYSRVRSMPKGTMDDEFSEMSHRANAGKVRRYVLDERSIGSRLNAGVVYDNAEPVMVVWDTADDIAADERRMILAHELGHIVHRDLRKLTMLAAVIAAASATIGVLVARSYDVFGVDVSTLPNDDPRLYFSYRIVGVYATLTLQFVASRVQRDIERAADNFALDLERDPGAFRRLMVTLVRANRAPVGRAFGGAGCSHPPVRQRLQFAADWEQRNGTRV